MDYINDLHELCETISREIGEANDKIRSSGGKLTAGDIDYVDKLTHALKSVKAVIAMGEDDGGYSGRMYPDGVGGSYRGSYNRGGSYARRNSMGRYSRDNGYSRAGLADELREMMHDAPDEQTRQDIKRLADKVERM